MVTINRARLAALRGMRMPAGLVDGIVLLVLVRLALGAFALLSVGQADLPGPCHFELARNGWTTFPPLANGPLEFPLVGVWQRWDACWYSKIATFGYEPGQVGSAAFFPLFPALTALTGLLLGVGPALAGLLVNAVAYLLAVIAIERLVATEFGPRIARRTVLYLSIAPAGFFLFAPFTEAVFLATSAWALLAARERRWTLTAIAAVLAALTRTQGVFLVLPIALEAWRAARSSAPTEPSPGGFRRAIGFAPAFGAVLAPVAGLVSFVAWTSAALGTTPLDQQALWGGSNFHAPWDVLGSAASWAIERHDPVEALNVVALLVGVILLAWGIPLLPAAWTLWAAPQLLLIAVRLQPTPLTSTVRYVGILFPLFVVAALLTGRGRGHDAWVVSSTLLLALLLGFFLHGTFVA